MKRPRQYPLPIRLSVSVVIVVVVSISLFLLPVVTLAAAENDFACNPFQDSCPTKYNGVCDSEYGSNVVDACRGGDCGDCDQCRQFNYDCQGCTSNGCFFCPGDATCYNSNQYQIQGVVTSCNAASDYTTDTDTSCQNSQSDRIFEYVYSYSYVVMHANV